MADKEYWAHIADDGRRQTVQEHLKGTAALCRKFAAAFGAGGLGELAGLAHDIGKYSDAFQRRLQGGNLVDHATAGAYESFRLNQFTAAFCVAGHHGGLPDGGGRGDSSDMPTFCGRMRRAAEGRLADYSQWRREICLPELPQPVFRDKNACIEAFFFIRMLYSCLVDADFLDTELFMSGKAALPAGEADMPGLYQKLLDKTAKWFPPKGELNALRCTVLEQCQKQGKAQKPGLFTLTVPTGGGKTVASLAFALSHACEHNKRRIIYIIPYTSIIEQTAGVFRDILGAENVLEHHSNVQYNADCQGVIKPEEEKWLRAAENWDMPVVVTTAVQFFESLYANRSSRCRKLHNLANSVIIFDEAQMLPLPYLRPCVAAIAQLVAGYGVTAVLCTATQPALAQLFQEFLPGVAIPELCPEPVRRSSIFRRVQFRNAGQLSWAQLQEQLLQNQQVLCIVNSRQNAQTVFAGIQEADAYHLSTLMTPAHRQQVLAEIRNRLAAGLPCRVVSTSLIEAGVDVDFPAVFREEAGLDSILQAAGRCNREGKNPNAESIVTVFQAEVAPPQIFSAAIAAGQEAMAKYTDLAEPDAVSCYFQALLQLKGESAQDQKAILPQIQKGDFPFRSIAEEFHLIEQDTRTIYIPIERGQDLIQRLRQGERSRQLFRELGQYSVAVYAQQFQTLADNGALEILADGSGILLASELYSPTTGLIINQELSVDRYII